MAGALRAVAPMLACGVVALACGEESPGPAPAPRESDVSPLELARAFFGALPEAPPDGSDPVAQARVELGRKLFFDARLSGRGVSCDSCHDLDQFGVDAEIATMGHRGQRAARNVPTVYNASLQIAQFWDGRADAVEDAARGPVGGPAVGAARLSRVLPGIPAYEPLFRAAFPDAEDPVRPEQAARAIGAFVRRLVAPSRFDAWLAGDADALTEGEVEGLVVFMDTGCVVCHSGATLGGNLFQKLGVERPYDTDDPGRYAVTGKPADRKVFKVPSLRNVAETAPYLHDGSVPTLGEAVRLMGRYQLSRELDRDQIEAIKRFLLALSSDLESLPIARPDLPPDTSGAMR